MQISLLIFQTLFVLVAAVSFITMLVFIGLVVFNYGTPQHYTELAISIFAFAALLIFINSSSYFKNTDNFAVVFKELLPPKRQSPQKIEIDFYAANQFFKIDGRAKIFTVNGFIEDISLRILAVNDCWQSDISMGPYLVINDKKIKTYLIAFLDDSLFSVKYKYKELQK
ncbi:hypothetical protein ACETAC_06465 [Aceticella autotrophica]|uniref:Uncharacterized protein n=1 Tax=Aceticella autotrophica TaxID=2755338 RepID=A0A974Y2T2_9THEO|nr:hypothetical protein [Aceticella autotrophica]QSZ26559.1 hypothetical protein ACETAC_06465 [Aceticella autotrophica]